MTEIEIGHIIKEKRSSLALTQWQVADLAGVSQQQVNRLENGTYGPTIKKMNKVLDVLGLRIAIIPV